MAMRDALSSILALLLNAQYVSPQPLVPSCTTCRDTPMATGSIYCSPEFLTVVRALSADPVHVAPQATVTPPGIRTCMAYSRAQKVSRPSVVPWQLATDKQIERRTHNTRCRLRALTLSIEEIIERTQISPDWLISQDE